MSDKDNTFKFNPKDINDKPHVERSDADEFTAARRTRHSAEREKDNKPLIYVSIALMVALIVVIVIGIIVLSNGAGKGEKPENEEVIDMTVPDEEQEEEEAEEEEEKKEVISSWSLIFDADSISSENGKGYKISATFFDKSGNSVFSGRKVYITSKTDIRDNGKRVSAEAFAKLLSNQSGDMIFFEGTVNEGTNEVVSIKYNSSEFEAEEEEVIEEETEEKEEKEEPEKEPEEEKKEEAPAEKEEKVEEEKPVEEEKTEEPPAEAPQPEETPTTETPAE